MNVEVSNISFGYNNGYRVLDDISFQVKKGELFGIVGTSGSGKTTLLRIIAGILTKRDDRLFQGHVKIGGQKETGKIRRQGFIGLMSQQASLLPNLSVEKNILFPTKMTTGLESDLKLAEEMIEMVGLQDYRSYLPRELSGGMIKRAELARTFITKPKLLLLDEPFGSLDYAWKMDLYSKLLPLLKLNGSTAIIVSHDISELILLTNRIMALSKTGKFIDKGYVIGGVPQRIKPNEVSKYLIDNNEILVSIQSAILNDKQRN